MNADDFFELHSIEEINKKTKISPISLRFIKNKEFDKLPRVKFVGFIRLIEKKYKVDLNELIKEYEGYFHHSDDKNNKKSDNIQKNKSDKIKEKRSCLWILILIIFVLTSFLYFKFFNKNNTKDELIVEANKTTVVNNVTENGSEKNNSENNNKTNENIVGGINSSIVNNETNISNTIKYNTSSVKIEKNIIKEYNITILPNEMVWFRALNIDNNKSVEYLTSKPKILKGNYYIKFGHGNITVLYDDKNITPNTKKIVRILFKNGKYEYLKKPNEYEK
ncbi:conserved hypothetical protein [Lebetimonas natsushimae]|uniref:Uncharacterized protein n=1 Tax=Lebetimonas natsushimae TaxID=1936991 RepID=A0A292YCL1_9BACT|nr:hypothetical protein [Lebetimonas natsushimae]GAX87767.1 conserved hypothetical protein [Lebetimonas natsushimae]